MPAEPGGAMESVPRVVMVVNNALSHDARVTKTARTLARAGASVTVLGVASPGGRRAETSVGGVTYVRLPVLPARKVGWDYALWALRRRRARLGPASRWRTTLPVTGYYAAAFTRELRALYPDVVHVHDVHLLDAVAQALTQPLARPVPGREHRTAVVYDAHEYVAGLAIGGARTQRVVQSWAALERELIGSADVVLTVAPQIAQRLQREHGLPVTPTVVYNAPLLFDHLSASRSLRAEAGVGSGDTLLVYSGALSAARGVDTVIRALAELPGAHLAVVAVPFPHPMAGRLADLAAGHGVGDRLHFVPPVPSHEVPAYLSGADIAVSPIMGSSASYDMALPNKLFEMLHAGLPIVTSDIAAMSAFVREHGLGQVFAQGDPADCAAAVRRVLAAPPAVDTEALRTLRGEYSWQGQEQALVRAYQQLVPGLSASERPWDPGDLAVSFD